MSAIKKLAHNRKFQKLFAICMCMMICACSMIPLAAAEGTTYTDKTPVECATEIFNAYHEQLNMTTILSVIAVGIGASLGIFLGQWAVRKIAAMIMRAFKKGTVKP